MASVSNYLFQDKETERKKQEEKEQRERVEKELKEHVERVLKEVEERERKERQERDLKEHVERVLREVEERERKKCEEIERKEREELERKELEEIQRKEREEREWERVRNDILRLQNEMEVDARAHYLCAEYYGKWKFILFVSLLIFGGALVGFRALFLDWKVPLLGDPWSKKTAIAVFALGAVTFVISKCYNAVADSHEKHYNAERNCRGIVERVKSLLQRGFTGESSSSIRDNYDGLLQEKESFNKIRPEKCAYQNASKK